MALYGGINGNAAGKKILTGTFTPTSTTTTINTEMRTVDAAVIGFLSAMTSTHAGNYYVTSTNGAVRITHMGADVVGASAVAWVTASAGWAALSYIIIGDEQPPAAS